MPDDKKCPHCGKANGFYANLPAIGHVFELVRFDGRRESDYDGLIMKDTKWVRCMDCRKKFLRPR